ncbi:hypothetical protein [Hyphomicrobium sp.]|jgi:hypothetical protein|uniref:hypothetical protein n=1 Tax=Hyphomicrobium sp. TaxID=82 RepID=UPI002BBA6366|nr:hypothetical protein [Hyphomicrobium sp.]HVZ05313.1 hypothetical protein [Hyphomicrobium sp.]
MGEPRLKRTELRKRRSQRKPWKATRVKAQKLMRAVPSNQRFSPADREVYSQQVFTGHEFFPPRRPLAVRILLRIVGLASDVTLLILLSPILAGWYVYRVLRNFRHTRLDKS